MIRGNIFKNWNKTCYIANKIRTDVDDYGNEINYYAKAVKYKFNIQPAGGEFDIALYGEKVSKVYRAIVPIKYFDKIKEGDIAYLEGAKPERFLGLFPRIGLFPRKNLYPQEAIYATLDGNYIVDSVRPQNLAMAIYFRKLEK